MPTKIRPLNQSAAQVQEGAKAEKARKAASKKALREALAAAKTPAPVEPTPAQVEAEDAARAKRAAEDAANARAAHWVDFCALNDQDPNGGEPVRSLLGGDPFYAYLAEQGLGPDGFPLAPVDAPAGKQKYFGPMLALRERSRQGAYVTGANGNPHCGDAVAAALSVLPREAVVSVCVQALGLGHNPYTHLNPGQQSMNLRNKLRHAVRNGFVQLAKVEALVAVHQA